MRASFPLGLKIPLWLLLNLLALSGAAGFVFFAQVGLGWEAMLRGPVGACVHSVGDVVMGELAAAPPGGRNAVLDRLGSAYRIRFTLWTNDGRRLAGPDTPLPKAVRDRLAGERGTRPETSFDGPPERPPGGRPPGGFAPPPQGSGADWTLFFLRAGTPAEYWIGIRVPWNDPRTGRPVPATLIALAPSLASIALLFDWSPWFWAIASAFLISVLFWWPFVRGLTRSLAELSSAADRIAEGKLATRVSTRRRDEIGSLGLSVNRMAERIESLVAAQRRFLADAAHELCSPLARLQLAVGILEQRAPEDLHPALSDVREEAQTMSDLTGALLDFTRGELKPPPSAMEPVELAPLIRRVLDREALADRVAVRLPAGLRVEGDAELLGRAVGNLVRNACRYASGAAVEVAAREEGAEVVLEVLDRGPGIPEADLGRLGEPFFRPEAARTREGGGAGLGLAIVRTCAQACGGSARFGNRPGGGFAAEIRLRHPPG